MRRNTLALARQIRRDAVCMVHRARASHIGSALSMADLLAVLYGAVLQHNPTQPDWPERDRFILSKGHGTVAVYAVLAACGYFPRDWLETYGMEGTRLAGHISSYGVPGVEFSTGSLGHGLPIGCGLALAARHGRSQPRVFVLMSDGELDEGSNWEAILFAAHQGLENLVAIVDYNKLQGFGAVEDVLDLHPLVEKWQAFGWGVQEIDGHDHGQILTAMDALPFTPGKPSVIIAHTVKGKGVSFMENQLLWHYKSPDDQQLQLALEELALEELALEQMALEQAPSAEPGRDDAVDSV